MKNIVLNTDSYKVSMWKQYPPGSEAVYSYVESRGGKYEKAIFFGVSAYLQKFLERPVTHADVDEAKEIWEAHGLPFNEEGWRYIVNVHNGHLPVSIRALPEGTEVPVGVPMLTVESTDEKCFWLATWLETSLLRAIWYPTTVATVSAGVRKSIQRALAISGDMGGLNQKLHDFGARGVSSEESAAIGGAAHLLSFDGTDNMSGIMFLRKYYGADMPGISIPASEHSTITSWGEDREEDAYRNMIDQFAPNGIFACVSDSYDIYNASGNIWGDKLKQAVIDSGAVVVVRPDSGDPVEVVSRVIEILGERFGYTMNRKGFKVLNNVRIIQGDGCTPETIDEMIESLIKARWSIDNVAFGMGGGLLQKLDRDTLKFALKCSAIRIDGDWKDVQKSPVTDRGKKSKGGRVRAARHSNGTLYCTTNENAADAMQTVFLDGEILIKETLDDIRSRVLT